VHGGVCRYPREEQLVEAEPKEASGGEIERAVAQTVKRQVQQGQVSNAAVKELRKKCPVARWQLTAFERFVQQLVREWAVCFPTDECLLTEAADF
jgi:hypothetical protein